MLKLLGLVDTKWALSKSLVIQPYFFQKLILATSHMSLVFLLEFSDT